MWTDRGRHGRGCGCLLFVMVILAVAGYFLLKPIITSDQQTASTTVSTVKADVSSNIQSLLAKVSDPSKADPADFAALQKEIDSLDNGATKTEVSAQLAQYAEEFRQFTTSNTTATSAQKSSANDIAAQAKALLSKVQSTKQ